MPVDRHPVHLETTPALEALASHCADDLAPATFVEPEHALSSHDAGDYANLHRLMTATLDYFAAPQDGGSLSEQEVEDLALEAQRATRQATRKPRLV